LRAIKRTPVAAKRKKADLNMTNKVNGKKKMLTKHFKIQGKLENRPKRKTKGGSPKQPFIRRQKTRGIARKSTRWGDPSRGQKKEDGGRGKTRTTQVGKD